MILNALALAMCAALGPGGDDWLRVDSVRAIGFERTPSGVNRSFTIVRSKGSYVLTCSHEVDGQLGGVVRIEVSNDRGVYTWIPGNPKYVLQLGGPSVPQLVGSVTPLKFRPRDMLSNPKSIEHTVGRKVQINGDEPVAARDCRVLSLSDGVQASTLLWVDQETGMVLREQDRTGNDVCYDRLLTRFELEPKVPDSIFALPQGAIVIKGLISPTVLIPGIPAAQYDSDLASYKALSGGSDWIKRITPPSSLDYVGSRVLPGKSKPSLRFEFLNPATGDSVAFLQLHDLSLYEALGKVHLPGPTPLGAGRCGFQISSGLSAVEWRSGDTDYVLVGTLSMEQLEKLAS